MHRLTSWDAKLKNKIYEVMVVISEISTKLQLNNPQ